MARNEIFISAPPEAVFEVLGDPRTYAAWVVGAHEVRAADNQWPAAGTALDHSVGVAPLLIKDETSVVHARPPVMLELCAKARPLPTARVTLHLRPEGDGTHVTMIEDPASPLLARLAGPVVDPVIRLRNSQSLKRLKALAERTTPRPTSPVPERG